MDDDKKLSKPTKHQILNDNETTDVLKSQINKIIHENILDESIILIVKLLYDCYNEQTSYERLDIYIEKRMKIHKNNLKKRDTDE